MGWEDIGEEVEVVGEEVGVEEVEVEVEVKVEVEVEVEVEVKVEVEVEVKVGVEVEVGVEKAEVDEIVEVKFEDSGDVSAFFTIKSLMWVAPKSFDRPNAPASKATRSGVW